MSKLKIAIIGSVSLNEGIIPPGYIKWGFNRRIKPANVWFDVHKDIQEVKSFSTYGKHLKSKKSNTYLSFPNEHFPEAQQFPFKQLIYQYGKNFTNSVDWLLAYAINLKPETIRLQGITVHPEGDHAFCRQGNEYYIGVARGKGINVYIPKSSFLCHPDYITPDYEVGLQHGKGLNVPQAILENTFLVEDNKLYGIE